MYIERFLAVGFIILNHIVSPIISFAQNGNTATTPSKVSLVVIFDQIPNRINISKAPLKYNKKFAYSFTLDDGLASAYSNVLPMLKGGKASNGTHYQGFFYTDGCGHNIPFKAGVAWNSVNNVGLDIHIDNPSCLTWQQLDTLCNTGWDILNHGYSHKTRGYDNNGLPNLSLPDKVYDEEINANIEKVTLMTQNKIKMTHFVVPSGDNGYYERAFANGAKAVYDQNWQIPGGGPGLMVTNPLDYYRFLLNRNVISNDAKAANRLIDLTANTSTHENQNYWVNGFTHDVETKASSGGVDIDTLFQHMAYVEKTYGAKGQDQIWMAPLQEVFEYCTLRDYIKFTWKQESNKVYIDFDLAQIPDDLRWGSLTLKIDSDQNFSTVEIIGMPNTTFKGNTNTDKLINLDFTSHLINLRDLGNSGPITEIHKEDDLGDNTDFAIFPNPVENQIFLKSNAFIAQNIEISILDTFGKEIKTKKSKQTTPTLIIDTELLDPGTYILRIKTDRIQSKVKVLKFLKSP